MPPYSPDLNPIEWAFSKVKRSLRVIGAWTKETLVEAIGKALDVVGAPESSRTSISGPEEGYGCHRTHPLLRTCEAMVKDVLRSHAPAWLSANIIGMGYQVVASTAAEFLPDEVWMDLIALASKHGFSAPRLSLLGRYKEAYLIEEEAAGLYAALERALFAGEPAEHIPPEADTLDRDTDRRVSHVLLQPERKTLRPTPPWR